MSEAFRKYCKKGDVPPAASIKFKCARLHRAQEGETVKFEHNTIYDVLKSRGWKEVEEGQSDWTLYWCDRDWVLQHYDSTHLELHQRVNHFRNHYELTRKDLLAKNLKRMRRMWEREDKEEAAKYDILPTTFVLPQEYSMFTEEFKKCGGTWIMKPVGKSQGAGIFMVNKLSQVGKWKPQVADDAGFGEFGRRRTLPDAREREKKDKDGNVDDEEDKEKVLESYIVQRYLEAPLLVGGKKFDLRLYCLVTSYNPLTIYLHRGGFCRFSMSRYTMDKSQLNNFSAHLTNVAVQKHTAKTKDSYLRTGGKWDLAHFKAHLMQTVGSEQTNALFTGIEDIMIYASMAVQRAMINDKHCFELYGYDVLIDANYKPWLLEVNASPSLTANTPADYNMKFELLDDVLTIIDVERYLSGTERSVGGFDLIYRNGRIAPPENALNTSFLGCEITRKQVYRLAKQRAYEMRQEKKEPAKPKKPLGRSRTQGPDDRD